MSEELEPILGTDQLAKNKGKRRQSKFNDLQGVDTDDALEPVLVPSDIIQKKEQKQSNFMQNS